MKNLGSRWRNITMFLTQREQGEQGLLVKVCHPGVIIEDVLVFLQTILGCPCIDNKGCVSSDRVT